MQAPPSFTTQDLPPRNEMRTSNGPVCRGFREIFRRDGTRTQQFCVRSKAKNFQSMARSRRRLRLNFPAACACTITSYTKLQLRTKNLIQKQL